MTLLLALVLAPCALESGGASAQGAVPYRVGGIAVEVEGKTPQAAKNAAVARGAPKALRRLVTRLARGRNTRRLRVTLRRARDLLAGYEVEKERFSDKGYVATLAYRFDRRRVRRWLDEAGLSVVDAKSRPALILPVWRARRGLILWDEPNPWRGAWARLELPRDGLVPIVTGAGDLQDLQAIDGPQAAAGEAEALARVARRYEAGSVVVAVATPSDGKLRIEVRRHLVPGRRMQPLATLTVDRNEAGMAKAARQIVDAVEEAWRQRNQVDDTRTGTLRVVAPLDGLAYWTTLRSRLGGVPLVKAYRVVQFGTDRSILDIDYAGSPDQLRDALAEAGLTLTGGLAPRRMPATGPDSEPRRADPSAGRWVIRLASSKPDRRSVRPGPEANDPARWPRPESAPPSVSAPERRRDRNP